MKIRAQIAMVLNLDKCIGCHTCSRHLQERVDQPRRHGIRLVQQRRDQARHRLSEGLGEPGALERRLDAQDATARSSRASARKWRVLANIFANPDLPEIDDYYEPFTFDYEHLQKAPEMKAMPTARPRSLITGERMEKIEWGPNWEEILGGEFAKRSQDYNFEGVQKEIYGQFENTFMMYLPRLCEHCLNPACVAACPSGAIYKREEDGIVLIDQDKCRGWRMCVSGCPYKKIYYNWSSGKSEKCIFCYPRIEAGQPTVCSETCVGRIRYLGVVLYDADRIEEAASVPDEQDLYQAQLDIFLDPNDPDGDRAGARGRHSGGLAGSARKRSPVWKMAMEWKVAFPLHPGIPHAADGLVRAAAVADPVGGRRPARSASTARCRTCGRCASRCKYLANLLTAGDEAAGGAGARAHAGDARLHAGQDRRRRDRRGDRRAGRPDRPRRSRRCTRSWRSPTTRTASSSRPRTARLGEDAYDLRGSCGFSFGNGCSGGETETNLFGSPSARPRTRWRSRDGKTFKVLSALLTYPTAELHRGGAEICCGAGRRRAGAGAGRASRSIC